MASTLNASTSSGLISSGDTSGVLALQTANTTALTVDGSQNIGIGTTTINNVVTTYRGAGVNNYIQFTNSTTGTASTDGCLIGVSADDTALRLRVLEAAPMIFTTSDTERMRIDSSGNVGIGTTSPSQKLEVATASGGTIGLRYIGNSGYATVGTDANNNLLFSIGNPPSEKMRIDSSGNLMIGDTSSTNKLYVYDNANRGQTDSQFRVRGSGFNYYVWLDGTACYIGQDSQSREIRMYSGNNSNVGTKLTANSNAWATYSDERLKDIIEPIENAAQKVSTLRTVIGKYKTDEADTRRVFMIAQDVQAVLPEAVTEDAEGMLNMAYDHIVPLLSAAIKELKAINDTQAETINALTARIVALESKA